ncbi:hypothetical protein E2C01_040017 [Portunus trituberculatus]|uniref:Uncharacterized protein n=1 Tax=Portunus trituberculatus TaxID=210409 RepID=A0A5B7FGA2_PORTR|nr:hypothetical protein [Portunus trituberculatus]
MRRWGGRRLAGSPETTEYRVTPTLRVIYEAFTAAYTIRLLLADDNSSLNPRISYSSSNSATLCGEDGEASFWPRARLAAPRHVPARLARPAPRLTKHSAINHFFVRVHVLAASHPATPSYADELSVNVGYGLTLSPM